MKVEVSFEKLKALAEHAQRLGTEAAFVNVFVDWAEQANAEMERLRRQSGKFGVALMMIREGCENPSEIAADILAKFPDSASPTQEQK